MDTGPRHTSGGFLIELTGHFFQAPRPGKINQEFTDHRFHHGVGAGSSAGDQDLNGLFPREVAIRYGFFLFVNIIMTNRCRGKNLFSAADIISG